MAYEKPDRDSQTSDFPLQQRGGKTVFRYNEREMAWCDGGMLGIHHVYPAGTIGLGSDPKLLEVSRNMIEAMARGHDDKNGLSSWYPACARGLRPEGRPRPANRFASSTRRPGRRFRTPPTPSAPTT